MKRGRCDSPLCRARQALTIYLDKIMDEGMIQIDRERNTNRDILHALSGNRVKLYIHKKEEKEWYQGLRLIPQELYDILYELCESEEE